MDTPEASGTDVFRNGTSRGFRGIMPLEVSSLQAQELGPGLNGRRLRRSQRRISLS